MIIGEIVTLSNFEEHMNVTKMIGMIFLAIYLILTGLATMAQVTLAPMASNLVQLLGVAAGVLILVSIGRFHKEGRR
jgi:hypothetical protein